MPVTEASKIKIYYQALLNREPGFVGIFYVGVKTTGVFCIATCRARKPKLKNVEFFTTINEALDNGYRPCKVCKPTENTHKAPAPVVAAISLLEKNPGEKISDFRLRQNQISPELVRRWFKKNYGVTFHDYQRMVRINSAHQELKSGKNIIETAFNVGYESLSGFGYTYKKVVGESPKNFGEKTMILISRLTTPLGPMFICATDKGICLLEFVDRKTLDKELKDLQRLLNAEIITGENNHIQQAKNEIAEYFAGQRRRFDVALQTPGTTFQNIVWESLREIPYGQTSTYQQQAVKINRPRAVRAMAAANGANRIAIIIPCHRVIGKNGSLTGYGGGIERKRWLIDHEQNDTSR